MLGNERNVALVIVLTIVTCGLYNLYWIAVTNDEVNSYIGEQDLSGAVVVLLSIVTCGIYAFVWYYQIGKKLQRAQEKALQGATSSDDAVVYLLLAIFGFGIVSMGLIQNNLNRVWANA